jgi:hypothetical protein
MNSKGRPNFAAAVSAKVRAIAAFSLSAQEMVSATDFVVPDFVLPDDFRQRFRYFQAKCA